MIDDYEVIFAGVSSADLCIFAVNRPNIPAAERDIETLEVPGVDGAYHIDNGRYKEMTISIEMNYIGRSQNGTKNGGKSNDGHRRKMQN